MPVGTVEVRDEVSGALLAGRVAEARTPLRRLRGLLGREGLAEGEGLLFTPCNGVHTIGMRFPIDVVFLDREHRVLRVDAALPPGRVIPWVRGAHRALEVAAGAASAAGVMPGARLQIGPTTETSA